MTDNAKTKSPGQKASGAPLPARRLRMLWRRYAAFKDSTATLTWGQIIRAISLSGCVLIGCFTLLYVGYRSARNEAEAALIARNTDKIHLAAQHQYDSDLALYVKKAADFQACLATAATRVDDRVSFRAFMLADADNFSAAIVHAFPESDLALQVVHELHADRLALLDQLAPALVVSDEQAKCAEPGPVPVKPEGLD